jgi:hypothetical protein
VQQHIQAQALAAEVGGGGGGGMRGVGGPGGGAGAAGSATDFWWDVGGWVLLGGVLVTALVLARTGAPKAATA